MKTLQKILTLTIVISCIACSTDEREDNELDNTSNQFVLWNTIDFVTTINGADLDEEVVAIFPDGTVTKDLERIFKENTNIEELRTSNPEEWGSLSLKMETLLLIGKEMGHIAPFSIVLNYNQYHQIINLQHVIRSQEESQQD